jgi:hypothetical protein
LPLEANIRATVAVRRELEAEVLAVEEQTSAFVERGFLAC